HQVEYYSAHALEERLITVGVDALQRGVDRPAGRLDAHPAEQVELVLEVLEQRTLGDPGLPGHDCYAAHREAPGTELGHGGPGHPLPLVGRQVPPRVLGHNDLLCSAMLHDRPVIVSTFSGPCAP